MNNEDTLHSFRNSTSPDDANNLENLMDDSEEMSQSIVLISFEDK